MTIKSSISLTDQQDRFARSLVEDGRYSSLSAVIQQSLDLLRQKTETEHAETKALQILLEQRLTGPFITAGEMEQRIGSMIEQKRRDHGLDD